MSTDTPAATVEPSPTVRDYTLVIVAYRSASLVAALIEALGPDFPIVIVDNYQGHDGLRELVADRPGVRYVEGPGAGYAAAANIGAEAAEHDTLVMVNPDSAPTPGQLDTLVGLLRGDDGVGQVCATVVGHDGKVELGAGGWEPSVRRAVVHALGAHKLFPEAGLWARPEPYQPIDLDWCCAAVAAVSRPVLRELGGFDESFFVYNEDVDFSRKLRRAGYRQLLRTDILVPHRSGTSGDTAARMLRFRGASMMRDVRRHHGLVTSVLIKLALTGGSLARAGVQAIRSRRPAADRHLSYARGLWFGPPSDS